MMPSVQPESCELIVVTGAPPEQVPDRILEARFPSMVRRVMRKPVNVEELERWVAAALHG